MAEPAVGRPFGKFDFADQLGFYPGGAAPFFASIRDWVDQHRFGFVTGDRLLRHLQAGTDADLAPIYAAYLAEPEGFRLRGALVGAFPE